MECRGSAEVGSGVMIEIDKTYCLKAANMIEKHTEIHYKKEYPHAIEITEALNFSVKILKELSKVNCNIEFR